MRNIVAQCDDTCDHTAHRSYARKTTVRRWLLDGGRDLKIEGRGVLENVNEAAGQIFSLSGLVQLTVRNSQRFRARAGTKAYARRRRKPEE